MSRIKLLDKEFQLFITEEQIQTRINEIGAIISTDYKDKDPIFLSILNGAFMFTANLVGKFTAPCRLSFLKVSSYHGTGSSGQIKTILGLQEDLKDEHIILVDDIVDTGLTMSAIVAQVKELQPASVEIATLFSKPESHKGLIHAKYVGFQIPNEFIVGFGLDYEGYGRNLPDIYHVK